MSNYGKDPLLSLSQKWDSRGSSQLPIFLRPGRERKGNGDSKEIKGETGILEKSPTEGKGKVLTFVGLRQWSSTTIKVRSIYRVSWHSMYLEKHSMCLSLYGNVVVLTWLCLYTLWSRKKKNLHKSYTESPTSSHHSIAEWRWKRGTQVR